jgi:geranylgeranyl diphosphate synthase type II
MKDLARLQATLEEVIQALTYPEEPKELYQPISYTVQLPGKRIRPLLVLLASEMYKGNQQDAIHAALAVELFHNFTLIHDDIMDEAPIRRGRPSVYKKWSSNVAILSGDAMMIQAYQQLTQVSSSIVPQLLTLFNKTAIEVCEGQQMDMNFEQRSDVTLQEYLKMIELKTAVLLGASLQMGAITGLANKKECGKLSAFGRNMGVAFQLQDDWLDIYGDEQKTGKQSGGDIIANKKTFLFLKARELANPTQHQELYRCFNEKNISDREKVECVKNIYDELELGQLLQAEMHHYFDQGLTYLNHCEADEPTKKSLAQLATSLMDREA